MQLSVQRVQVCSLPHLGEKCSRLQWSRLSFKCVHAYDIHGKILKKSAGTTIARTAHGPRSHAINYVLQRRGDISHDCWKLISFPVNIWYVPRTQYPHPKCEENPFRGENLNPRNIVWVYARGTGGNMACVERNIFTTPTQILCAQNRSHCRNISWRGERQ